MTKRRTPVPRLALTVEEACEALGVGWDFWSEHVAPTLPIAQVGRRKLIPVSAVEAWLDEHARAPLDDIEPGRRR